jgi:hypothetical protein
MIELLDNHVLAFASDTQAPMLVEKIWLRSFKNRQATQLLFDDVRNKKPKQFFLLGDVVNLGYSNRQWKPIDKHLHQIREDGIGIHAIMGNHEVMGNAIKGEAKFQERFPEHKRTGFAVVQNEMAVILLNSNFPQLSPPERKQQVAWLQNSLEAFDSDPEIQFVITCCHHSPYTNSRIVKPSVAVQEQFLPHFLASKKSQLFLSGHAHAFEHFVVGNKDFMVIGGGGGLRQPLRTGIGSLTDLAENYKPMFHYVLLYPAGDHLKLTSWHLSKDFRGFEAGLHFDVKKRNS